MKFLISAWLLVGAVYDIRLRKLPLWWLLMGGIAGLPVWIKNETASVWKWGTLSVGVVLLLTGFLIKNSIGTGDGLLFTVLGCYFSFFDILSLLFCACVGAGLTGMLLLAVRKGNLKSELPFVPFVFLAFVFLQLAKGGVG